MKTLYVIEFLVVSGLLAVMVGKAIKWGTKGWPGPWTNPMTDHDSDCAVHNEPALPKGECDCRGAK